MKCNIESRQAGSVFALGLNAAFECRLCPATLAPLARVDLPHGALSVPYLSGREGAPAQRYAGQTPRSTRSFFTKGMHRVSAMHDGIGHPHLHLPVIHADSAAGASPVFCVPLVSAGVEVWGRSLFRRGGSPAPKMSISHAAGICCCSVSFCCASLLLPFLA